MTTTPLEQGSHPGPTDSVPAGLLHRVIESQIVPRLLLTHAVGAFPPAVAAAVGRELTNEDVEEFVRLVRGRGEAGSLAFVDALLDGGVTAEAVYLDLLAPAARRLGAMWEADACDFVEVTVALGRLQRVLRSLSRIFVEDPSAQDGRAGRALLACMPGEQHTLGMFMVAEFFVRAGWSVNVGPPLAEGDLLDMLKREPYDLVGFSLSCDTSLSQARRQIELVRARSVNRGVRVIIGGRIVNERPELVEKLGADAFAMDALQAPRVAAGLL